MSPSEPIPEQFQPLLEDLTCIFSSGAAMFLDHPIFFHRDRRPHLILGPAKKEGAAVKACQIKNAVFSGVFDLARPLWFVFTEDLLVGNTGPYGPFPGEAPSIWDQPGLMPPGLKERAASRTFEQIDPYLLEGPAYRQWILFVKADEIDVKNIHQACARWGRQAPGPRLRARLFCLQPQVPVIGLPNELEGAMVLLAGERGALSTYARRYQDWFTAGSADLSSVDG